MKPESLTPLKAHPPGPSPEGRAGALFRAVAEPRALGETAEARIAAALNARRHRLTPSARSWRLGWAIGVVGMGSLAFAAAATTDLPARVAAAVQKRFFHHPAPPPTPPPSPAAEVAPTPPAPEPSHAMEIPPLEVTPEEMAEAPKVPAPRRPHSTGASEWKGLPPTFIPATPPEPPPAPPAVSAPAVGGATGIAAESALVQRAIEARVKGQPAHALEALDDYAREFPAGQLRSDAVLLRIDVLLDLNRRNEVLALLEGLAPAELARLPRHDELRVLHGELLAEHGRCPEAVDALQTALSAALSPALEERAWYAHVVCAARGAPSELEAVASGYLRRFPGGRHASQVRALMH